MDIIITYDIKRNHTGIKSELKSLGYEETIVGLTLGNSTKVNQQLSNTTLLKYGVSDIKAAFTQVHGVINRLDGGLDRMFCAELAIDFAWIGQ